MLFLVFVTLICNAVAKDNDEDEKPADPDTGESTFSANSRLAAKPL
jgi:hypothetical protein